MDTRVFERTDIPQALRLWETTDHIGLSTADTPEALSRFLLHNPGLSFCTVDAGHLAGTILCGSDGRRGYIHHLAVAARYRQRRIGAELVTRSLKALADIGIEKCHAFVFHDNPYGELFWRRSGWTFRDDLLVYSKLSSGTTHGEIQSDRGSPPGAGPQ